MCVKDDANETRLDIVNTSRHLDADQHRMQPVASRLSNMRRSFGLPAMLDWMAARRHRLPAAPEPSFVYVRRRFLVGCSGCSSRLPLLYPSRSTRLLGEQSTKHWSINPIHLISPAISSPFGLRMVDFRGRRCPSCTWGDAHKVKRRIPTRLNSIPFNDVN